MIRGDTHVDDWAEIAVDYLDGRVDSDTRTAVEAHLSTCPECAARLRRQQYVVSFLQDTALDDPPEGLEYGSIGQIIFPAPGDEPVFKAVEDKKVYRTPRWYRELRHWIPAAVAVVALLSAVVAYGVVRSGSGGQFTSTTTAGATTTAAASATTAAPVMTELSADTVAGTAVGSTATTAAAGAAPTTTTTAASAGSPQSSAGNSTKMATTNDPNAMVRALQAANAPTFVAFQADPDMAAVRDTTVTSQSSTDTTAAGSPDTGAPTTTDTVTANVTVTSAPGPVSSDDASTLLQQIQEFTGLQPVDQSLWLGGPTFAVYLPRKDASKLVDMVRSLSAEMGITVTVGGEPPAAVRENCARLLEHKASFPVLKAHRAAQPATWGYNFTTSTIVPPDQAPQYQGTLPDAGGEHVLVVIWIAQ